MFPAAARRMLRRVRINRIFAKALRRFTRRPATRPEPAAAFLADGSDWITLWHANEAAGSDFGSEIGGGYSAGENVLSPHL